MSKLGARGKRNDLVGIKFGMLTVVERAGSTKHGKAVYVVKCDCGNVKTVIGGDLVSGKTISCGCFHSKQLSDFHKGIVCNKPSSDSGIQEHKERAKYFHDYGYKSRIHAVWHGIKNRCENKNDKRYKDYGGRGIKMCKEWSLDFTEFARWAYENGYDKDAKFGECTIDRIDVNGDYEPSNCRFESISEQNRNKRTKGDAI